MNNIAVRSTIKAILESIAAGDAMGMPTEFMTRKCIKQKFGFVDGLIPPYQSQNHSNLRYAQITDDTEQNIYLIREYCEQGRVDVRETAACLLKWVRDTGAIEKRYIGPSSLKALKAIDEGEDPAITGLNGTTCGGIMRIPAAVLCSSDESRETLERNVLNCCIPTHNTSTALEAAMSYAFAMKKCFETDDMREIIDAAIEGATAGVKKAPYIMCAASSAERIKTLQTLMPEFDSGEALLDYLYDIYGTGLESEDICAAVFGIFMFAGKDTWLAIRLAASVGGDTDTIAALAGALCTAYARGHNIPVNILRSVLIENGLDFEELSAEIVNTFHR